MRWPWQPRVSADLLAASWADDALVYVRARGTGTRLEVLGMGVEHRGADEDLAAFARRLEARGLKGARAHVMLRPRQYQWLQIEAPGVAPEELRSAARYQIRDMLDAHVDDVTLDVMRVGDGQQKAATHLFVVAASNAVVRSVVELGAALRWNLPVIEVQETAQRNLQNLLAGQRAGAHAALVLADSAQAVLTICANDEIFFTRRLEIPPGFLEGRWDEARAEATQAIDAYAPVEEYVPGHAGDMSGLSAENVPRFEPVSAPRDTVAPGSEATERAQRFLLEVQRSLDLWDRSWSTMPLTQVRVHAGTRSEELAIWLARELGQEVSPLQVAPRFPGFKAEDPSLMAQCWPLLGLLLRTESRSL